MEKKTGMLRAGAVKTFPGPSPLPPRRELAFSRGGKKSGMPKAAHAIRFLTRPPVGGVIGVRGHQPASSMLSSHDRQSALVGWSVALVMISVMTEPKV